MFHNLFVWLSALVTQNQIFSGVIGAGLVGTVAYALKSVPLTLYNSIKWATTIRVSVANDVPAYEPIVDWLGGRMEKWWVRDLKLAQDSTSSEDQPISSHQSAMNTAYTLGPGYGTQWLIHDGWPYEISRTAENSEHASAQRVRETLSIMTFGFKRDRMNALLKEAFSNMVEKKGIKVFSWQGWWNTVETRRPRPLDSVILPTGQAETITGDIERFIGSREVYARRGVPYRRGYLFSGAPGTGKSSLALALAGHYLMPIYVLNIGSVDDDDDLFSAVGAVPSSAILLIEDIDAAGVGDARTHEVVESSGIDSVTKKEEKGAVTLSGLLNCLDGVIAKEGRILIMTSNHPERLDPALIRPGRVDKRIEFALASAEEAARLFSRFFDDAAMVRYIRSYYEVPLSAAEIQGICQDHADEDPSVAGVVICGQEAVAIRDLLEVSGGRFKDAAE